MTGLLKGSRKDAEDYLPTVLSLWGKLRTDASLAQAPLEPSVLSVGIHILNRAGQPSEAHALMEEMAARGQKPGVQVYNMIISGHGRRGDVNAALGMLERMALRGVAPNKESYNAVVSCLCSASQPNKAMEVVDMAATRGAHVDEWAWSAIIQVCLF
jgi:pentatricopeptide repeat protein